MNMRDSINILKFVTDGIQNIYLTGVFLWSQQETLFGNNIKCLYILSLL